MIFVSREGVVLEVPFEGYGMPEIVWAKNTIMVEGRLYFRYKLTWWEWFKYHFTSWEPRI